MDVNDDTKHRQLVDPLNSETTSLLSLVQPSYFITLKQRLSRVHFHPKLLFLPSKPVVLIIYWTALVSAIYVSAEESAKHVFGKKDYKLDDRNLSTFFVYLVLVFGDLFYPFAGFMADVCCGRYRTVVFSLCILLCGYVCFSITSVLLYTNVFSDPYYTLKNIPLFIPPVVGIAFLTIGLSFYFANYVQLGLDQLMELPSEYLGLYVHWLEWAIEIGVLMIRPVFLLYNNCTVHDHLYTAVYSVFLGMSFLFLCSLFVSLLFGCGKRRWFYAEPGRNNPYKTVLQVLNFTRKHKYPLRRSAFTYCGDETPCRIDFAKEKYGGPFTTQQVEDVKTFLRIVVMLIVMGPIYSLEIPVGPFFASFSDHIGRNASQCTWSAVFHNTTIIGNLLVVIVFPVYIWLIYAILRNCIPKFLIRIWIGELLFVLGMMIMFFSDLSGHIEYYNYHQTAAACLFNPDSTTLNSTFYLELPWIVNILPAFLTQAAIPLLITATFEFISAQSPKSMTGLIIGVFYAIRGFFKLLGAITALPFSLKVIWDTDYMKDHLPPVTNCGFGYLLLNCIIGLFCLVFFSVAAKRYKYRERDDPPYNQMNVERVWANSIILSS